MVEPTEGQLAAFVEAWEAVETDNLRAGLRAALNYEEPYTDEDKKYDFALQTTDTINGVGTYAELNQFNPNPMVQRAIKRWEASR